MFHTYVAKDQLLNKPHSSIHMQHIILQIVIQNWLQLQKDFDLIESSNQMPKEFLATDEYLNPPHYLKLPQLCYRNNPQNYGFVTDYVSTNLFTHQWVNKSSKVTILTDSVHLQQHIYTKLACVCCSISSPASQVDAGVRISQINLPRTWPNACSRRIIILSRRGVRW